MAPSFSTQGKNSSAGVKGMEGSENDVPFSSLPMGFGGAPKRPGEAAGVPKTVAGPAGVDGVPRGLAGAGLFFENSDPIGSAFFPAMLRPLNNPPAAGGAGALEDVLLDDAGLLDESSGTPSPFGVSGLLLG